MFRSKGARPACAVAAAVVALYQGQARGGATFDAGASGAKWNFQPNVATTAQQKIVNLGTSVPSSGSMPSPNSYQLSQTFTSGAANSIARGSIGYLVNSTTATFTLAAGTGVTQTDPTHLDYPNDSRLRVDFDGRFNPTSPSFGPVALGYVSITVGGVVAAGGSAKFVGSIGFLNGNTGAALRSNVIFNKTYTGNFAQSLTSSAVLGGGTIPVGTPVRVRGYFEFMANNGGGEVEMNPLNIEFGNAPPTATYYGALGSDWSAPGGWTPPPGSEIDDPSSTLPLVPNGIGQRARFINTFESQNTMFLDVPITLGALDIDVRQRLTFQELAPGIGTLTMDVHDGAATIHVRNVQGPNDHALDTSIALNDDLEVTTDGAYVGLGVPHDSAGLIINGSISGGHSLTKLGGGTLVINAPNSYTGGTVVAGGVLSANIAGSLGTGPVTVAGGQLNYNAPGAAATGVVIQANDGGQIDLGDLPGATDQFSVGSLGIISGSSAELAALSTGTLGNLQIAPGAMIAHESFDTTLAAGNPSGLSNTPTYVFGIASDFTTPGSMSIVVGSASASPWIGFGSDRSDRIYGQNSTTVSQHVLIAGEATLMVHAQTLTLNAQLVGATVNPTLAKRGAGTAILANTNNPFDGTITVEEGALLVHGSLPAVQLVATSAGATIGGTGAIGGTVIVMPGGRLAPGGNSVANQVGVLSVASLSLSSSLLDFQLGGATGDQVVVVQNNALTLSGVSTFNLSELGDLAAGSYTLIDYSGVPLADLGSFALASPVLNGFNLALVNNVGSTSVDLLVTPIVQSQWNVDAGGNWPTAANWSGGVPDGIEHVANFGNVITAPRTVTVSAPRTVGAMNFDSASSYTVAGASTITLATGSGDALINVVSGSHVISAPLALNQHLTIDTAAASGIVIGAPIDAPTRIVSKDGLGTVQFARVRAARLDVVNGVARIAPNASPNDPAGTSVVEGLNIFSGAQLDLTNNSMVVDYAGAVGTLVGDVRQHLQAGRLTSSATTALTVIGYGDNALLGRTVFAGQSVDATSVLIKYTYKGDANLDGHVDVTDLAALATAWQTAGPWTSGDFNYSGFVDVSDLIWIATNWQAGVGAPLAMTFEQALASVGLGGVPVPEPTTFGLLGLAVILRRRRHPR